MNSLRVHRQNHEQRRFCAASFYGPAALLGVASAGGTSTQQLRQLQFVQLHSCSPRAEHAFFCVSVAYRRGQFTRRVLGSGGGCLCVYTRSKIRKRSAVDTGRHRTRAAREAKVATSFQIPFPRQVDAAVFFWYSFLRDVLLGVKGGREA